MKQDSEVERSIIDATTVESEAIINEIETPSLFSHQKLILIKRLSENKDKNELRDFFIKLKDQDIPEDIIIWETQKVRGNTNYFKSFKNVYESPDLSNKTYSTRKAFIKWSKKEIRDKKIKFTAKALQLLNEYTNYDPERFIQELNKLKLTSKKEINENIIKDLCPDTLENQIWDLVDNINSHNTSEAARQIQNLINQGKEPYYILIMMVWNLRLILMTKLLKEKGFSIGEIASKTHTNPYPIKKILNKTKEFSYKQIKLFYQKLCNIDYAGKTGQLDVKLALDILLCVI